MVRVVVRGVDIDVCVNGGDPDGRHAQRLDVVQVLDDGSPVSSTPCLIGRVTNSRKRASKSRCRGGRRGESVGDESKMKS